MPSGRIASLLHHGGVTFATVQDKGLYTSVDQGVHWELARAGGYLLEHDLQVVQGYVMARNSAGDSLFFSNNGGQSWMARYIQQVSTRSISAVGDKLFTQGTTLGATPGLYRSDDLGATWVLCGPILPFFERVIGDGNAIHAFGRHVFTSSDGGSSFQQATSDTLPIPSPWGIFGPTSVVRSGARFIAHHETVIDLPGAWWEPGNSSWTAYPSLSMPSSQTSTVFAHQGDVWISQLNSAVYRLPAGGDTWSSTATPGLHALPFSSLQLVGNEVFATEGNNIHRATDASTTLLVSDPASIPNSQPILGITRVGPNLFASRAGLGGILSFFRSIDDGVNWTQSSSLNIASTANVLVRNDTAFCYGSLSGEPRCYMMDAQGAVLGDLNAGLFGWSFNDVLPSMITHNGALFAAITSVASPFTKVRSRRIPSDEFWQLVAQTIDGDFFGTRALGSFDGNLYLGPLGGGGVLRSDDDGATWTPFSAMLPELTVNKFHAADGFLLLASDRGVFVHEAGQTDWVDISNDLPVGDVLDVVMTDEHVWALLEGSGVWRLPRFGHVSVGTREASPALHAWPNPCRERLNIQGLSDGNAEVLVRDVLGRAVLMRQSGTTGGSLALDVNTLPAGYYSCEVGQAGQRTVIRFVKQ